MEGPEKFPQIKLHSQENKKQKQESEHSEQRQSRKENIRINSRYPLILQFLNQEFSNLCLLYFEEVKEGIENRIESKGL